MNKISFIDINSETEGKARVAVLFSGGIDSSVLAFIAHTCVVHYEMNRQFNLLQSK